MDYKPDIGDRVEYTRIFTTNLVGRLGTVLANEPFGNICVLFDNYPSGQKDKTWEVIAENITPAVPKVGDTVTYTCSALPIQGEQGTIRTINLGVAVVKFPTSCYARSDGTWHVCIGNIKVVENKKEDSMSLTKAQVAQEIKATEDKLAQLRKKLAEPDIKDVTEELEVKIVDNGGGYVRLYLNHNGNTIVRVGMYKAIELTSFAESHGYALVPDGSGLRGTWFKVTKTENDS